VIVAIACLSPYLLVLIFDVISEKVSNLQIISTWNNIVFPELFTNLGKIINQKGKLNKQKKPASMLVSIFKTDFF
jgi:hypothetical protein